ncbi:MAG: hypothetical protein EOO27_16570 [Comamonadaceae bacterium]|nr:MAG: hypothetical protein EOO27_16570 [Comamonadaceae bacterium]
MRPLASLRPGREGHGDHFLRAEPGTLVAKASERLGVETRLDDGEGVVADGPFPETKAVIGGFSIIQVPTREEALEWAAKIAVACRCAQEVRDSGTIRKA